MKFRSYNQQLLIAQALIGNVFNDIVIDRRNHGLNRDYSKPITMDQIIQKQIEIPCIFGDRSVILRSLQNEHGAIKLPLYILTSRGIRVDTKREADLHIDLFYQQDESLSRLPQDHPLYRPYNLKKRRGLPITISYNLTMITKYKEDLDQMCTNWMVHWRPDIYVKWWHPRNKIEPLQSEILWGQAIEIQNNEEYEATKKFKWQASTQFTFKTWIFPGLNYEEDSFAADEEEYNRTHESLIQKINVYATTPDYDGVPTDQEGFPVLGDLFEQTNPENSTQIGMYAVPTDTDLTHLDGNNTDTVTGTHPGERDPVQKPQTVDVATVYKKYADYVLMPPINNEIIQMKYVYYFGGAPVSAMQSEPMSGDILFHNFSKDFKRGDRDFGDCYSDQMLVNWDYDIQNKKLSIYGKNQNDIYTSIMSSQISSQAIKQQVLVQSNQENIKLDINRGLTFDQKKKQYMFDISDKNLNYTKTSNIAIWNDIFCKRQHMHNMGSTDWQLFENMTAKKNYTWDVRFKIETLNYLNKINGVKQLMDMTNQKLQLKELTKHRYKIFSAELDFWNILSHWDITKKQFQHVISRKNIEKDGANYHLLANNSIYIVIKSTMDENKNIEDELYDYGVVTLPVFDIVPIFNVTLKDHQVVYGLGTQYYIGGK